MRKQQHLSAWVARRREGFRAYIGSEAFLTAFNGLAPERRQSAMRAYARAETLVKRKHLTVDLRPSRRRVDSGATP